MSVFLNALYLVFRWFRMRKPDCWQEQKRGSILLLFLLHCTGSLSNSELIYFLFFYWFPLLVYKALQKSAPDYICDLIQPYTTSRSLRSCNQLLLSVPHSRCKSKGDRAFAVAAPKLWNSLLLIIRASPSLCVFKSNLKTHFYTLAFEWCCVRYFWCMFFFCVYINYYYYYFYFFLSLLLCI